ncbi:hypothetical protein ADU18_0114 [Cronobacter phage PBES 02]|uniref:Inh N-terminal domain-containing protein n=1 Tax=Cronobacter phage PBES 02 TaxID=1684115 RepID=A0A0K1YAV3_9CAUD|nr:hypothetical protein ADU18_0114 [Cronobacter phage PBES 02]AKY04014.1 hypothetical protein ADU18_0114 [Cronobacter phage PBES 02]
MAQPHLEVFQSEYHMLKFFGQYLPKLDVDASARLAPFLYSYDNELVMGRNLYEFLNQIEAMTALGINTIASVQKGAAFLVFFDETPKSPEKFLANIGEIKAARANVIPEDVETEVESPLSSLVQTTVIDPAPEVKVEVKEEKPASARTDEQKAEILAHAETLRDDTKKAAAKAALESYALTMEISLSKAKTFDAMLEDLKAAL